MVLAQQLPGEPLISTRSRDKNTSEFTLFSILPELCKPSPGLGPTASVVIAIIARSKHGAQWSVTI